MLPLHCSIARREARKPILGRTSGLAVRTNPRASCSVMFLREISHAVQTAADLEMPSAQCTRQGLPAWMESSILSKQVSRFSERKSAPLLSGSCQTKRASSGKPASFVVASTNATNRSPFTSETMVQSLLLSFPSLLPLTSLFSLLVFAMEDNERRLPIHNPSTISNIDDENKEEVDAVLGSFWVVLILIVVHSVLFLRDARNASLLFPSVREANE